MSLRSLGKPVSVTWRQVRRGGDGSAIRWHTGVLRGLRQPLYKYLWALRAPRWWGTRPEQKLARTTGFSRMPLGPARAAPVCLSPDGLADVDGRVYSYYSYIDIVVGATAAFDIREMIYDSTRSIR